MMENVFKFFIENVRLSTLIEDLSALILQQSAHKYGKRMFALIFII